MNERGREPWLEEQEMLYGDIDVYRRNPQTQYKRFRPASNRSGVELSVLQELALWREGEAQNRDRPRGHIVSDEALCDLARRRPKTIAALQNLRGLIVARVVIKIDKGF